MRFYLVPFLLATTATAFSPTPTRKQLLLPSSSTTTLHAKKLDAVTYLRTEWISAALCTNQTPRAADVALQLGCQDGRIVTFLPRTIRTIITSTIGSGTELDVAIQRQLKQQTERRWGKAGEDLSTSGAAQIVYANQRMDALVETADESVDVVVSLQSAAPCAAQGGDWRASVAEAARVLKPGGRFLFVEATTVESESYLECVQSLVLNNQPQEEDDTVPVFDDVGFDDVDLVLQPHIAGVAIKAQDAGLSSTERANKVKMEEQDREAELSITAFERGIKKRRRKKKNKKKKQAASSQA